jgi:glycosyltransferase involved in cell wall biosynthesis
MQIALLLDYTNTRITGGPQGVAYDTVEGLKKNHGRLEKEDIHLRIMSTTGSSFRSVLEKDERYTNITVEYFNRFKPTSLSSDLNYYLHLKKMKDTTDLLHSHDIAGAVASSFLKIPTILTLHGITWKEMDYYPSFFTRFTFDISTRRFRYVSRHLKKLIAISPYVINEVNQFLGPLIPSTEVIENPVSDFFFEQEKKEKEGLILYPANISPLKNQYTLIQALHELKKDKIRFQCILPGPIVDYAYYQKLQELIRTCGLEKEVIIPGNASLEQMLTLYSEASVLVITSYQETAPLIISEAMATGTPVIASCVSGIPYMVSDGKSGLLIDPHKPAEIADRLRIMLTDNAFRKKCGMESQRIAKSRWKSEGITSKLIDLYLQQG